MDRNNKEQLTSESIGLAIRSIREKKGLKQGAVSELATLSRTHLSDIEGARRMPSIITLNKIAGVLDIPLSEIIKHAENIQKNSPKKPFVQHAHQDIEN